MANSFGFSHLRALDRIEFVPYPQIDVPRSEVRSAGDDILDIIYSVDPIQNVPTGSIYQYLSDKTSDEVRTFIERNILVDLPSTVMDVPDNLRGALRDLDSEFIAKVSRNPYETNEDYESRVHGYLQEMNSKIKQDSERESWLAKVKSRYGIVD